MTKYKAEFEFEAASPEEAAAVVTRSFYLGEIEADKVKVLQAGTESEVFRYPFTQKLIRHLNEGQAHSTGEGDWTLTNDNRAGEDV